MRLRRGNNGSRKEVRVGRFPTRRLLDRLEDDAVDAFRAVTKLIEDRVVSVPGSQDSEIGWGQYLDEDHKSRRQWGRYGTSAAVRALACVQRATAPEESLTSRAVLRHLHPQLLPEKVPDSDPELKTSDFQRVVKLAYIVEGVRAQERQVVSDDPLPIVEHLMKLRHEGQKGWSSRDGQDSFRDRLLTTAVVLHSLRRFPGAQQHRHVHDSYVWLAKEVCKDGVQIDLAALAGIAFVEASRSIRELKEVETAFTALDERLSRWAGEHKRVNIDRPYFNGFVEHDSATKRDSTDYVFFSPELLTARYLLKRDERQTRRFVLRVVTALVNNIRYHTANGIGGYKIQGTMIRTVDQAWAMDLLETFEEVRRTEPKKLLPSLTAWLTSFIVLIAVWVVLFIGVTLVLILTGQALIPVITVAMGVIFTLALKSRR